MKELLLPHECNLDTADLIVIRNAIEAYNDKAVSTLFKINHLLASDKEELENEIRNN